MQTAKFVPDVEIDIEEKVESVPENIIKRPKQESTEDDKSTLSPGVIVIKSPLPSSEISSKDNSEKEEMFAGDEQVNNVIEVDLIPQIEESLEALLKEEISNLDGDWSIYFKRLDTGKIVSISNEPKIAASLIKLFVAGAYLSAVENKVLDDVYASDLDVMITESSNDSCNRIIDALGNGDASEGIQAVTDFATSLGCFDSQLNRKMLQASELENYTSVSDCGVVLESILNGTYVSRASSERLLELLKLQSRTWKIPADIPEGIETANKTGELSNVENDVAIVWSPTCTYILCIMVEDVQSSGVTQRNIASVSQIIYQYLNP